jgi:hypothetical protein
MVDQLKSLFFHPNKNIADGALRLAQIHDALKNGELNQSEYQELMDDVQRLEKVTDYANDLKTKIIIKESIDTILVLASQMAKVV